MESGKAASPTPPLLLQLLLLSRLSDCSGQTGAIALLVGAEN